MNNQKNHWIALYLSGQYPGKYVLPDKLGILYLIRQQDSTNFQEDTISLLHGNNNVEYYNTLLKLFEKHHGQDSYNELLQKLEIPIEVIEKSNNKFEQEQTKGLEKSNKSDFSVTIYKEISDTLDKDIKKYFFNGLKSKDYGVYLREILNYLSTYLRDYHNIIGLKGEKKEGEAVEAIFKNPDLKITGVDLTTHDGESKKEGLYKLLLGSFKNYRNILSHNTSDDLKINLGEYLETFLFVNQLIKEVKEKFPIKK